MKSLLNRDHSNEIIERIKALTEGNPAQWGKMNAAQMLVHTQVALKVAMGDVNIKRGLPGLLFGNFARKQLTKDKPFKHNLPTAKEFLVRTQPNFEEERRKLLALVSRFTDGGPDALAKGPHPFFGRMTVQEWDVLQWKHLDHHLRQFGV